MSSTIRFARIRPHDHWCLLILLFAFLASDAFAEDSPREIFAMLGEHCVKCHGGDETEGDVDLKQWRADSLSGDVELLQSVIDVLDLQEMPPEDQPQPSAKKRKDTVNALKLIFHASVAKRKAFKSTPVRRMNRFQYSNAITDLFDMKCAVFTLPERMLREHKGYFKPETGKMDDTVAVGSRPLGKSQLIEKRLAGVAPFPQDLRAEHGFDNRGDHLSMSPLLMQSFLSLGQSITESPDFGQRQVGIWQTFFEPPRDFAATATDQRAKLVEIRLEPFLTRAFRSPVEDDVLQRYVDYAVSELDSGVSFTDTMKSVAGATISSPKFLYLYDGISDPDADADGSTRNIELASRLSFFLWGGLPDEELLRLAVAGKLTDRGVLDAQVDRMLKSKKLKRFCDSFPAQWLQLERIVSSIPDREKFPSFYYSKFRNSMHMMVEPLLLFETVLIENLPITQLIDSNFTYRSKRLTSVYGDLGGADVEPMIRGGGVGVLTFNREPVTDRRNGGVITNAAVMTMTSGSNRTQPITRGAWIAGVIFNNPPKPPPADVPALDENPASEEAHLTLRERLTMHRERSDCKGCHEQIDPLGFALENYDPIGRWRDKYENERDIDTAGTLFRKHRFKDVVEFKDAILAEKGRFARGLAGHLLSFALARELGAADQVALNKIVEATAADDYRMQTLIKQVIFSEPFQATTYPSANAKSDELSSSTE